jgi:hypothetical protein
MAFQIDSVPRPQNDISGLTVTLGVGDPGGGVGVRVIVDDTVITSEVDALLALKSIENEIIRRTWPVS